MSEVRKAATLANYGRYQDQVINEAVDRVSRGEDSKDIADEFREKYGLETLHPKTVRAWCRKYPHGKTVPPTVREQLERQAADEVTKAVARVSQASIIQNAQEKHLEGAFRQEMLIVPGVRQHLESFKGHFLEIDPELRSYYREYSVHSLPGDGGGPADEIKGHLADAHFWEKVEAFRKKAGEADELMHAIDQEMQAMAVLHMAPLESEVPQDGGSITEVFTVKVVGYALASYLGDRREPRYHWDGETGREECDGKVIAYRVHAEAAHRALIDSCRQGQRIAKAASLLEELRRLREEIMQRIDRCLYDREYLRFFCRHCPGAGL